MDIDWNILEKWDVLFGIAGGIVLVFSGFRWIAKYLRTSEFASLLSWAIVGSHDEQQLIQTTKSGLKLFFAASVWGIIGAFIALGLVSTFILVETSSGGIVFGIQEGLIQSAIFGAICGALLRAVIWPFWSLLHAKWQKYRESQKEIGSLHIRQKQRVEEELKRNSQED